MEHAISWDTPVHRLLVWDLPVPTTERYPPPMHPTVHTQTLSRLALAPSGRAICGRTAVRTNLLHSLLIILLALSTGCAKSSPLENFVDQDSTPSMAAAKSNTMPQAGSLAADSNWIALEPKMQLPSLASVERSTSWDERIAKLPKAEQDFLISKNSQYLDVLRFSTPEDQLRLVDQGFPMPEEWAKARSLPEVELERLARQGNFKAQMFYIDRVIDQVAPVLKERGFGDTPEDRAL